MSKIGVAVGEEFPVQDSNGASGSPKENPAAPDHAPEAASGESRASHSEEHEQAEFARGKWLREGQRAWDEDVRNERAEWEARKRVFKEKIRAAIHDAVHANENRRHHVWGHSWRSVWLTGFGIGIAALALATHRRGHSRRSGRCHYYDDSDIETPSGTPHKSPPPDNGEPIVTPPPPRGH
jgi:hypothetical protein